jgi:tRNA A37 methylthiotransferase MiaB
VDCEVLIEKLKVESLELKEVEELKVGDFYNVEITKAEEFDLYGEII